MNGPSLLLDRLVGQAMRLHWTCLLLLLWIPYASFVYGDGFAAVPHGLLFATLLILCMTLHDVGHQVAARLFGTEPSVSCILPSGPVAWSARESTKPAKIAVLLAGPVVSLGLGFGFLFFAIFEPATVKHLVLPFATEGGLAGKLAAANFAVAAVNLLPFHPFDGGSLFRATNPENKRSSVRQGQVLAALLVILGLDFVPVLALLGMVVFFTCEFHLSNGPGKKRDRSKDSPELDSVKLALSKLGIETSSYPKKTFFAAPDPVSPQPPPPLQNGSGAAPFSPPTPERKAS